LSLFQVERYTPFSTIQPDEIRRLISHERRAPAPSGISSIGRLDLANVSTVVSENKCAEWASEGMREIQNLDSG
jgi:hypothetical protein